MEGLVCATHIHVSQITFSKTRKACIARPFKQHPDAPRDQTTLLQKLILTHLIAQKPSTICTPRFDLERHVVIRVKEIENPCAKWSTHTPPRLNRDRPKALPYCQSRYLFVHITARPVLCKRQSRLRLLVEDRVNIRANFDQSGAHRRNKSSLCCAPSHCLTSRSSDQRIRRFHPAVPRYGSAGCISPTGPTVPASRF